MRAHVKRVPEALHHRRKDTVVVLLPDTAREVTQAHLSAQSAEGLDGALSHGGSGVSSPHLSS